jgi:hypothetical protein
MRDQLYYQNRISKLVNNGKDNSNIVKKLQRRVRQLQKAEKSN